MIRWFANNSIAANLLMVGILLAGIYTAFFQIALEVSPSRQFNSVRIDMAYRGATAKDVERAILIPIENRSAHLGAGQSSPLVRWWSSQPCSPSGPCGFASP